MNNVTPAAMGMGSVMPYPSSPPKSGVAGVDPQTVNGMNQAYYGQQVPSAIPDYSRLQPKKGPFSFITDWFDHLPTWLKIMVGAAGSIGLFFATKHVVLNAGTWVRDFQRARRSAPWAKYSTKEEKKEIKRNMYELHDLRSEAKGLVSQVAADAKTVRKLEKAIAEHSAEINIQAKRSAQAARDSAPQWMKDIFPTFGVKPRGWFSGITTRWGGFGQDANPRRERIVKAKEELKEAKERLKASKAKVEAARGAAPELGKEQFRVQKQLALKAIEQRTKREEARVEELKGRHEEAEARLKELRLSKVDADKIKTQQDIIKDLEGNIVRTKARLNEFQDMTWRTWANAEIPKNVGISASGMPYNEDGTYFNAKGKCTSYRGLTLPEVNPIIGTRASFTLKIPSNIELENGKEWLVVV